MQEVLQTVNKIEKDLETFINNPPNIPLRVVFVKNKLMKEFLVDKIKFKLFDNSQIVYLSEFYNSKELEEASENLEKLTEKFGEDSFKYLSKFQDALELYITNITKDREIKKVLVLNDEDLYDIKKFDPIEFVYGHFSEGGFFVDNEIPLIWLTIGSKNIVDDNIIHYFKEDNNEGRVLKLNRHTFMNNILIYE